ncbi:hypothetical protein GCM10007907_35910 [Chitinimonas prasina]|uniref:histidine kinase n=1 Tax=Chitinimonas prasina TaxID=1434937 RepID=A0ABQ5YJM3_9NEIS|nr:EAL domain-containing protein [Chitinimonas prasina]GLR14801.1 hypothetical protein GCM10007907_35910 [Chitinimonas prasina]
MKLVDKFLRNADFRQQISIAVTAGVLCLALLSSMASSWQGSSQIRQLLRGQGEGVTESLARQSKLALLYDAAENANAAVEVALDFPDVSRVEIRHANGRLLLARDRDGRGVQLADEVAAKAGQVMLEGETDEAWHFIAPVMGKEGGEASPFAVEEQKSERIGYVRVVQSKATLKRMVTEVFVVNFATGFLAAFVLLFLIRLLTRRLSRPLAQLAQHMAQAEQGQTGVRADLAGPHDIAEMAQAFNSMIAVLEAREQELREARDEAMRFATLKAEFAATVSHEIRTPLNGVIGTLDILISTPMPAKQRQFVQMAWDSSQYLLDLVNNILDFSRLEAGKLELELTDYNPRRLSEDVIELLAPQAHQKGLDLAYLAASDVPVKVKGDSTRIRQVLTNLVGNAIKFTEHGEVVVRVALADADTLRFEVVDTGIGMSEQAQSRIFDSFTQGDTSTTRRFGGSGLGLSICRQLVGLMGGEINVESVDGKGSRFWFTLPLQAASEIPSVPERQPGWQGRSVLLVEESAAVRHFLEQSLANWGFVCTAAQGSVEALAWLKAQAAAGTACSLVILDSAFASPEGGNLPQQIRAEEALRDTYIIAMNRLGVAPAAQQGVDALLSKPLRMEKLLACIAEQDQQAALPLVVEAPRLAGRCRVLVAEDNRTNQAIAESMLAMLGCQVEIVGDGHEALRAFKRQRYDLVLMDCNMPHMDGYQATAAIRAMEAEGGGRVPIVAMTANIQRGDIEKCLAAGMDDHLPKPLTLGAVGSMIGQWAKLPVVVPNDGTAPEESPAAENREPLDAVAFGKLREALGERINQAVEPYLEDMPVYLEALAQSATAQDAARLRQTAHAIKGASSTLGAGAVASLAREIEALAEVGQTENAESLLSRLHAEYALTKQALLQELKGAQASLLESTGDAGLVLVVDDDRSTRSALRHALERGGFQVVEAGDGNEALVLLGQCAPDVILMDGLMPGMDGFTACARLQEMPEYRDIPVLMITALDDNQSIEQAFAVGASDYLTKPIHLAVVQQRVRRVVDATRTSRHVRHLAYHDTVTDLPNRAQFSEELKQAIERAERTDHALALLFLDLDRFKFVNDTLGHEIGDRLLKLVGQRIRHCVRSSDSVARLGGDEFTVLLDELPDPAAAANAAQKIERALGSPFEIEGHDIFISTSIGISLFPVDGNNASTLLRHADTAMYRAKRANGGFQFYEAGMDASVSEHLRLESALRRALEREELQVHYQPEVETISGHLFGMEALLRWNHPNRGMISPAEFIPLAEETGLIVPIGEWVLRTACIQAQRWLAAGVPRLQMAVNLSGVQLAQPNFVELVDRILTETGLPPHCLTLEITESVLMERAHDAVSSLHALKALGLNLAIDDFGTGYSSLSYLKRFPVNALKVDYSFTQDVTTDPDAAAIVTGIVALAHSLRLQVVAEGVETPEQRDFLGQLGCDYMQGYYLSRPVPAEQFESTLLAPRYPQLAWQGAPSSLV